jgi:hypothetical protein
MKYTMHSREALDQFVNDFIFDYDIRKGKHKGHSTETIALQNEINNLLNQHPKVEPTDLTKAKYQSFGCRNDFRDRRYPSNVCEDYNDCQKAD